MQGYQFIKRKTLWQHLMDFSSNLELPWVLIGDINNMLNVDDKLGGLSINPTRIRAFREYIDVCKVMDLGFRGPKFTWTNKHPNWHNNIKERLDRSLINAERKIPFSSS